MSGASGAARGGAGGGLDLEPVGSGGKPGPELRVRARPRARRSAARRLAAAWRPPALSSARTPLALREPGARRPLSPGQSASGIVGDVPAQPIAGRRQRRGQGSQPCPDPVSLQGLGNGPEPAAPLTRTGSPHRLECLAIGRMEGMKKRNKMNRNTCFSVGFPSCFFLLRLDGSWRNHTLTHTLVTNTW